MVASTEVLDAVSTGKVEAGYSAAGFWMGKMPAAPLFSSVPFGPDTIEYLAWFFAGNGNSLYQEMYDKYGFNVKVFICGIIPPETSGWFANEIDSQDDLSGSPVASVDGGGIRVEGTGVREGHGDGGRLTFIDRVTGCGHRWGDIGDGDGGGSHSRA